MNPGKGGMFFKLLRRATPEEAHEAKRQKILQQLAALEAPDNGVARVLSLFRDQTTYANYQKGMYGIQRFSMENFARNTRALREQFSKVSKKIQGPKAAELVMHLFAAEDTSALKEFTKECLLDDKHPYDFLREYYPYDLIEGLSRDHGMRQYVANVRLLKERLKDPSLQLNQHDHFNVLIGMKQDDFKSWLELMQIKTPEQFKNFAGFRKSRSSYPYFGFDLDVHVKNLKLIRSIFGEESWAAFVRGPRPTVVVPQKILPEYKDYYDILETAALSLDLEYKPKDNSRPSMGDALVAMKDIGLDATPALFLMAFGHQVHAERFQKLFSGSHNSLRYLYERDPKCELLKQYFSMSPARLEMFFAHQTLASSEDAALCSDPAVLYSLNGDTFVRFYQAYADLGLAGGLAAFIKRFRGWDQNTFKRLKAIDGKGPAHAQLMRLVKDQVFRESAVPEVAEQSALYIVDLVESLEMPFEPQEVARRISMATAYTRGALTSFLLKEMCVSKQPPESVTDGWDKTQGEIRNGSFDINNPLHTELEYLHYVRAIEEKGQIHGQPGYSHWNDMVTLERSGQREQAEELAIIHAAHESLELRKYIQAMHSQAEKLGRPLWVVPNYSYGLLHVAPIKEQLEVAGICVVLNEKVGSSESHSSPFVVNPKLFESVLGELVEQQPIIVVTDGSRQLFGTKRTGGDEGALDEGMRLPDAHRGYFNAIVAFNEAMHGNTLDTEPTRVWHDAAGLAELRARPDYQNLLERARRALSTQGVVPHEPYSVGAWNLTGLPFAKEMENVAKIAPADISGPTLIMCAMGLLDEQLPDNIRKSYRPGFYDDSGEVTCFNVHFSNRGITFLNTLEIGIRKKIEEYDRTGAIAPPPTKG